MVKILSTEERDRLIEKPDISYYQKDSNGEITFLIFSPRISVELSFTNRLTERGNSKLKVRTQIRSIFSKSNFIEIYEIEKINLFQRKIIVNCKNKLQDRYTKDEIEKIFNDSELNVKTIIISPIITLIPPQIF